MDKILLRGMEFYGYHGVMAEEKTLGQKFVIDVTLYLSLKQAGQSDDLEKSVNYGEVYNNIKEIVEGEKFDLIEALAERITTVILSEYTRVHRIKVRVKKPQAPIPGVFDYAGVEIERDWS